MAAERKWPNGYITGFCAVGDDHGRCPLAHAGDPATPGCHCRRCVAREAHPLVVVEATPDPAEAPLPIETGASAGTNDGNDDPAELALVAVERLASVVDLHRRVGPLRSSSKVPAYCEHCGRLYPCPTVQRATGEAS